MAEPHPLASLIDRLTGRDPGNVQVEVCVESPNDGTAEVAFRRYSDRHWDLSLRLRDHQVRLERDESAASLGLTRHQRRFVGSGEPTANDRIRLPEEVSVLSLADHLISDASDLASYLKLAETMTADQMLTLARLEPAGTNRWASEWSEDLVITRHPDGETGAYRIAWAAGRVEVSLGALGPNDTDVDSRDWQEQEIDRDELERTIVHGLRRMTEVLRPGPTLDQASAQTTEVEYGRLSNLNGQRVAVLYGTPEQIGRAHGQLLAAEARRCIDSTLYMVGLGETVASGEWFPDTLRAIRERVSPHIPGAHTRELYAMADAAGLTREEAELANVFPEFFHCSGFAVMDSATADGTLYHGRVLDYMTAIGLHHADTVFVIEPDDGRHRFVNVGYAGFIGSVTGMNDQQLSLGEMGGAGQGHWDGVPMATLMRRALEECSTLNEVKTLWAESPRTCEYYYVFADGKTNDAVAVAATHDSIEFLAPGKPHPRLGEGIADTVFISQGERVAHLRQRIDAGHGKIDTEAAMRLMDRPVAMTSNLHNVLMVPEYLTIHVAHANDDAIAADRPYVEIDLNTFWSQAKQPETTIQSHELESSVP
ncbi:MAG: C45 family peptidase [Planctomycetota bacterium]